MTSPPPSGDDPERTGPASEGGSAPPGYAAPGYSRAPGYPSGTGYLGAPGHPPTPGYPAFPGYPVGAVGVVPNDPLIPAEIGGWLQLVFGVMRRSFGKLALLALILATLSALYSIAVSMVVPGEAELRERIGQAGAAGSGTVDPSVVLVMIFGRLIPVVLVFFVLFAVAGAFVYAASLFIAVHDADGRPATVAEGLRFARSSVLPLIGWGLLAAALVTIGFMLVVAPAVYLGVVLYGSLVGVVVVERGNITRCFQLIKNRFWATFGRLAIAILIMGAYFVAFVVAIVILVVVGGTEVPNPDDVTAGSVFLTIIGSVLGVPVSVFTVAVAAVTYAELRFHENPTTTTSTLARELAR